MEYGNEINELISDGWLYDNAIAWLEFINGEE